LSVFGAPTEWVDLVDSMVPEILALVVATWQDMPSPPPDEKEDNITNELCRALRQNRSARGLMFQIHTQFVELEPLAGEDLGRLDIVFMPLVPGEEVYFCLENKRLNALKDGKVRAYASEYVTFGMFRFVKGQYSKTVRHGGMIAYVLDGDVARATINVETNVQTQHAALGMKSPGALLPSTILNGDSRARETHHQRSHEVSIFRIHHLFMGRQFGKTKKARKHKK
jgi:hypothetical protein